MGLIKALGGAVGGALADQWLEAIEPAGMGDGIVCCMGTTVRKGDSRSSNVKGTEAVISDGSIIHVYDRQAMLLVDGGRIVDFTAEPGMYKVQNSSTPSLFAGDLGGSIKDSFERFKFGGVTPKKQVAYYINLKEMIGIRFGTANALQYFDNFYNAELFLRCHGTYSLQITDPILFYQAIINNMAERVHIDDINEQFRNEFMEALQTSIAQLSAQGTRISQVTAHMSELSRLMRDVLDDDWKANRGFEVKSVGIASISYDEGSRELIDMRNKGAMLSDASVREGYVQGSIARGLEAAGSNEAGAAATFMGMGMGMQAGGGFMGTASQANMQQMQMNQQAQQAQQAPQAQQPVATAAPGAWNCGQCNTGNSGNFCTQCGQPKPKQSFCANCGQKFEGPSPKFCPNCGQAQ